MSLKATPAPEPLVSPFADIDGFTVAVSGRWLRIASIRSADFHPRDPAANPELLLSGLRGLVSPPDVFTFSQRLPDISPRFGYSLHWDNIAALPLLGYADWWEKRLNQDTRRCVRTAAKRGLIVRSAPFDDQFITGICGIYNETPFRQGRPFSHYGKDFETAKRENGSYADRSVFIGAYFGDELVGFLKVVYVGGHAAIMQILAKTSHHDRKPMNAMMAKAVEICNERKVSHLLYRKYVYHGGVPDSLTEFKRRNGFERINVPRYFVPLTIKGRMAMSLRLHLDLADLLPTRLVAAALGIRTRYYDRKLKSSTSHEGKPPADPSPVSST